MDTGGGVAAVRLTAACSDFEALTAWSVVVSQPSVAVSALCRLGTDGATM